MAGRNWAARWGGSLTNAAGKTVIFAEDYGLASEILFYTRRPVEVLATPCGRLNQFGLWTLPAIDAYASQNGLLVFEDEKVLRQLDGYFARITKIRDFVPVRFGTAIRRVHIYAVDGIKAAAIREAILQKNLGYATKPYLKGHKPLSDKGMDHTSALP